MIDYPFNKFRAAVEVLQRGKSSMVENLAEEILTQGDDLTDNPFMFNEFVESQGTRLHFLTMLMGQLEHMADQFDEQSADRAMSEAFDESTEPSQEAPVPKKRRPRAKKITQASSSEGSTEEL